MIRNLFCLFICLPGLSPALLAQWSEANFKSSRETILPAGAFVAGRDGGVKPYYITKVVLDGNTYITKIGEGWNYVTVPRGNSVANIGVTGADYNPFPVYCGDVAWARVGDGSIPANAVVVPTTTGNVYIARVSLESRTTGIGWLRVGQTEAEYIENGVLRRASRFNLLTHAAGASVVESSPSRQQPQYNDRSAPAEDKRVVVAPGNNRAGGNPSPDKRVAVDPRITRTGGNDPRGNTETGGITLLFVDANGKPVNGENTAVQITLRDAANQSVIKQLTMDNYKGELLIDQLAPGAYSADIKASYEENNSGNREGWTTTINLNASPNPLHFTVRGGVVAIARVVLKR